MRARTKIRWDVLAAGALGLLVAQSSANATSAIDPLMLAVRSGDVHGVLAGLGRGDDANMEDKDGHTPLMFAVMYGYASNDVVRALLAHGARVNARATDGMTALMLASGAGSGGVGADTIGLLLEAGADPNLQNRFGYTALMYAAHRDRRRYRISYPLGGHVEAEGLDGGALNEAPSVVIVLPKADSSTDRDTAQPNPYHAVHIRVEPDSEGLTFSEWLQQRRALDDDFAGAERLSLKGRAAVRVKMEDESGGRDCVFLAAGGVLGICLEAMEPDLPQDAVAESQRTFLRMLRSFEPLP